MLGVALSPPPPPTARRAAGPPGWLRRRPCQSERVLRLRAAGSAAAAGPVARGPLPAARGHPPPAKLRPSRARPATADLTSTVQAGYHLPGDIDLRFFVARSSHECQKHEVGLNEGMVACMDGGRRVLTRRHSPPGKGGRNDSHETAGAARRPARATRTRAPQLAAPLAGSQLPAAETRRAGGLRGAQRRHACCVGLS